MKGKYVGKEFPDYANEEIEIENDYSDERNPCYKIRFLFSKEWIDNMSDDDIEFDHSECVNCGSENVTLQTDKDICHECGYIYE